MAKSNECSEVMCFVAGSCFVKCVLFSDVFHAGIFCKFTHSLFIAIFAAGIFTALLIGTGVCAEF